jgi:hypothetical protein
LVREREGVKDPSFVSAATLKSFNLNLDAGLPWDMVRLVIVLFPRFICVALIFIRPFGLTLSHSAFPIFRFRVDLTESHRKAEALTRRGESSRAISSDLRTSLGGPGISG